MEFKKDVVKYAKENSYNIAVKKLERVRKRVQNVNKLLPMKGNRCRLDGRKSKSNRC